VLDTISSVPREAFVPETWRNLAFADLSIPLGHDQVMMQPKLEARLLQALEVMPFESALEVGTGSGYLTALLARLCKHVYSVDIEDEFCDTARQKMGLHGITNVTIEQGDASNGWDRHGPYDVIVLTGSAPCVPDAIRHDLRIGGRLFAVLGDAPAMEATLLTRHSEDQWSSETLFETELPRLKNFTTPAVFLF
jgi:protein-L-isoaspartate(D-aspartate) O-methyltransferase